ncbi:tellurite resistance TerB family protein [Deinococcus peraridilitoris]|uniref:Tellurite resistance protein n=1 Tax=Deinococcus peraridilitoris (strain DSM 19664 / LMG 22246 / CIP 109416 / KR-200) TaxID=937777 RepID=L0A2N1_DEIPD|nr:tellurite resistance TerB family protein [Deinococcus peraridilitoris]AFZ67457.1 tellurite resistance protein [Deinococcus peraridilitoris DSM 19664]
MSFWNSLKNNVSSLSSNLQTQVSKFKNNDFANASMAVCALIAAADGSIDPAEKQKTAGFIMSSDVLKVFNASELKQKFDGYCQKLEADIDFGRVEVIQAISKLRGKPDQARAVIQVGVIIGGADGHFDELERKALREACNAVGISPSEFDL